MTSSHNLRGRALWSARIRSRSKWARRWARKRTEWPARRITSSRRGLPDFVVIGAAKAGTSSLFEYLCTHPSVARPWTKEVRYFAYHCERGVGWYRSHFPTQVELDGTAHAGVGRTLTGEASPSYFSHPVVPERMAALLPDVRLVALLREPVARAVSAYHFEVRMGTETRPIERAFAECFEQTRRIDALEEWDDPEGFRRFGDYVGRGEYAPALARWLRCFDRSQLLIVESDRLTRQGREFARVLDHVGLPAWQPSEFVEHNSGFYEPPPASVRHALAEHYRPYNAALWELLGEDWGWDEVATRVEG